MSNTSSPNMGLIIPGVGSEVGPTYAQDVNADLSIIDQHNHAAGSGVPITPSGININAALTMNSNFLTNAAGVTLAAQSSTPANNTLYESGADLYFVDGAGNNVRITQSGAVAGTPGSISNLVAPASAAYVALSSTFVWQSNTSIAANMDFGAAIMRNLSPNSTFALTLQPPAALSSNYTITLPTLPANASFLQINPSGTISATPDIVGGLTTTNLSASAGIVGTQLANATITTTQIAAATILSSNLAGATRQIQKQIFTTSGTFTTPAGSSTSTIYKVLVIGGGGGGGVGGGGNAGGGGSAGGCGISWITGLAALATVTVTVGTGGPAGNAGSASSFGSNPTANGGLGGNVGGGAGWGIGVVGGTATGDIAFTGDLGGQSQAQGYGNYGGNGGSTMLGSGGLGQFNANGTAGTGYGSGGAGSFGGNAAGAGAPGIVIVEWVL